MALFNLQVKETTVSRLDRLAEKRQISASEIAALAIEEFVEREEWQIAEIETAMHEADSGDFASAEDVAKVLSKFTQVHAGK